MKKFLNLGRGTSQVQDADGKTVTKEVFYANYEEKTKFGTATVQIVLDEAITSKLETLLSLD